MSAAEGVPVPLPLAAPKTAGADGNFSDVGPAVPLPPGVPNGVLTAAAAEVGAAATDRDAAVPPNDAESAGDLLATGPAMKDALPVQGGLNRRPENGIANSSRPETCHGPAAKACRRQKYTSGVSQS